MSRLFVSTVISAAEVTPGAASARRTLFVTRQELYLACPNDRPNHVGIAVQRHLRAGRIQERDGKLYATLPGTEHPERGSAVCQRPLKLLNLSLKNRGAAYLKTRHFAAISAGAPSDAHNGWYF